jgi:mannose-6-phosphate isomerase-like protein (cupin superfamily)
LTPVNLGLTIRVTATPGLARITRSLTLAAASGREQVSRLDAVNGRDLSFVLVALGDGHPAGLHVHGSHDELMVLLQGSAQFTLESNSEPAHAGDVFYAPAGVAHAVEPIGACVLLAAFGPGMDPARPDTRAAP